MIYKRLLPYKRRYIFRNKSLKRKPSLENTLKAQKQSSQELRNIRKIKFDILYNIINDFNQKILNEDKKIDQFPKKILSKILSEQYNSKIEKICDRNSIEVFLKRIENNDKDNPFKNPSKNYLSPNTIRRNYINQLLAKLKA